LSSWSPGFVIDRRPRDKRQAISAIVIAVAIFIIAGVAIELVLFQQASRVASTSTTTTISTPTSRTSQTFCEGGGPGCAVPTSNVSSAVARWVADFNSRDVGGISSFYTKDAVVVWTSSPDIIANVLDGTYNGSNNIKILYGSEIGKTTSLLANLSDYKETSINQDDINVSLTLSVNGSSTVVGNESMKVKASQAWNYSDGQWQIVKENWYFVTFHEQFPVAATTFPQWTAIKDGQNPNLVEEKSFEWHAGPYVAASVYVFLAGILAYALIRLRGSRGSNGR
jgi:hypothetical protein